ncbi:hypothetical protein [Methylorubrum thiocyanatum]
MARDLTDPEALDGYVVTPSVRDAARRILSGLATGSTQRAFRVVGPYGVGKSAFGLLLARLVTEAARHGRGGPAKELASGSGIALPDDLPDYAPIVLVGRRSSLQDALVEAVADAARGQGLGRRSDAVAAAADALAAERSAGRRDDGRVLALMDNYARAVRGKAGRKGGVLLVIDEMGRFLEHMSLNRQSEDPSFVQRLAERAGGASDAPIAVVALLHHRFADYAAGLGRWAEAEWAKSAERFEEVAFHASTEQSLFLLGQAMEPTPELVQLVGAEAGRAYAEAGERGLFVTDRADLRALAPRLYPLHPAVTATLANLSRRFGQNERSLFSFLQSLEPHGLQRFALEHEPSPETWYTIPDIFDYLASQGYGRMTSPDRERRWALALETTAQGRDLPPADLAALKCVALLALLEPVPGLAPDASTIAWCLSSERGPVEAALARLCSARLLYRRPHRDDYSLWSSTSVDLDGWLEEAKLRVPAPTRMPAAATGAARPRPLVAHRHYHRTGTLRAFAVLPWDGEGSPPAMASDADGAIVVLPVHPDEAVDAVMARHADLMASAPPLMLFCVRKVAPGDLRAAHELALWRWIYDNCQELRVDDLARREVRARVAAAEAALDAALMPLASPGGAFRDEAWVIGGRAETIGSRSALSSRLSDLCDRVFRDAPVLRNELVNRPRLSSAAASARMRLLELMVEAGERKELGLVGTPPEKAIYLSTLAAPGLHRDLGNGRHGFVPPEGAEGSWLPAWRYVESTVERSGLCRFTDLLSELGRAPFGMRSGPALILVAAVMLHHRRDMALMERNTFQPEVTGAHFMRLAKNPANFSLRHLGGGADRRAVLERLAEAGAPWEDEPKPEATVKAISEALFGWWHRLPDFAKETSRVGATAQSVRLALRKAREPIELLLEQLPRACGVPVSAEGDLDADTFVETLNAALLEIRDAAPAMRSLALAHALDAFGVGSVAELRRQVQVDYVPHKLKLADHRMRSFVDRASTDGVDDVRWMDGVAGLLCGRRLDSWQDATVDQFGFEVRAMAQRLSRWLATMRERGFGTAPVVGVHVTTTDGAEKAVMLRPGLLSQAGARKLARLREALGEGEAAEEALAHLVAERWAAMEQVDG